MAGLPSVRNMLQATSMPWIYVCREPTQNICTGWLAMPRTT